MTVSFAPESPPTHPEPPPNGPFCVMSFNASDPSGAAGLAADLTAISSASCYVLPVTTACYVRDTRSVHQHVSLDADAVEEQARCVLEDIRVHGFKVGFAGNAENVGIISEILSDYSDVPVVGYMPSISWMDEGDLEDYLDACADLLLPQITVLVGNHHTLCRWLLPDWSEESPPGPREVARAAAERGVPYTLVTGINVPEQFLESHLATPESVIATARYERFEATFTGAGDTLSATLCALIASGTELQAACAEAFGYLDQCLDAGFQPGMGHAVPDRLFWAHDDDNDDSSSPPSEESTPLN